jgi:hypothetical protein
MTEINNERAAKITGTNRGNYGLMIAKQGIGKHVWQVTDPKELNYTSAMGVLGLLQIVDYKATTDANGEINATFNHPVGYPPIMVVEATTYDAKKITVNPTEWHSYYVTLPDRVDIEVTEIFNFEFDGDTFTMKVTASESDNIQDGYFAYLANREYVFRVYYYFNEVTEE